MQVVANRLDNECYRNVKNEKVNEDDKFATFSLRKMTMGLEDGKQKEVIVYFSEGMQKSSEMIEDIMFGISLKTQSKDNLRTRGNSNKGSHSFIQIT